MEIIWSIYGLDMDFDLEKIGWFNNLLISPQTILVS